MSTAECSEYNGEEDSEYSGVRPNTAECVSSRALVGRQEPVFRFWAHEPSLTRSGVSKVETMSPSSTSASRSVPSKSECSIDMTPASAKRCSGKL